MSKKSDKDFFDSISEFWDRVDAINKKSASIDFFTFDMDDKSSGNIFSSSSGYYDSNIYDKHQDYNSLINTMIFKYGNIYLRLLYIINIRKILLFSLTITIVIAGLIEYYHVFFALMQSLSGIK